MKCFYLKKTSRKFSGRSRELLLARRWKFFAWKTDRQQQHCSNSASNKFSSNGSKYTQNTRMLMGTTTWQVGVSRLCLSNRHTHTDRPTLSYIDQCFQSWRTMKLDGLHARLKLQDYYLYGCRVGCAIGVGGCELQCGCDCQISIVHPTPSRSSIKTNYFTNSLFLTN